MINILLVDDEPDLLDIMQTYTLQVPGRNCLLANNVFEAETLLPKADIVVADMSMPHAHRLEALLSKENKPIGRVTGLHVEGEFILNKPYSLEGFENLILKLKECIK